jgi:hypothetical protein
LKECAVCHHDGGSGPFALTTYAEVRKHADDIAKVTRSRFMPPWLPDDGCVEFMEKRGLASEQIRLIAEWVALGAPEGLAADLPPSPPWTNHWQLGTPDLVVQMQDAYTLPAGGQDVYRNFIVPIPVTTTRYVKAIEFRPGTKAIHHAFIRVDHSGQSRRLQAQEGGIGFGDMEFPAGTEDLAGHFGSWQPGRRPLKMPEGLPVTLSPPIDLVLQIHMQPTGKPEPIQSSVGLYFTEVAPTNTPFKVGLSSYAIDIPPRSKDFSVQDSYTLPIDAQLLGVLPHAHYLAKRMEGFAKLPDGMTKCLLLIKDWDFNWQSDYRYAAPIILPKGTTLSMRFTYDNSAENVRNPHQPPVRVEYGPQSGDEMAELWFQLLPLHEGNLALFQQDYQKRLTRDTFELNTIRLRRNPDNAHAHAELAKALLYQSKIPEALAHLRKAVALQPSNDGAHYHLGVIADGANDTTTALAEFLEAIHYNPSHFMAHNNAGLIYLNQNRFDEAEFHFKEVLRIHPGDTIGAANLRLVSEARSRSSPKH